LSGFLIYSIALLLVVTPVLYIVVNSIITSKVDETLLLHKKEIQGRLEKFPTEADVRQWEDLDGEVVVKPLDGSPAGETIVTIDGYRVLNGSVEIKGKLYSIQARISLVESDDLIKALVFTQVLVLIALIAGMLAINWWNSKTVWKPFYNTLQQLRSFRIERNHPVDLTSSSIAEFNDLNTAIEDLTKRNQQAYVSQREFAENAAHEMQTPLAVFQSKVDMLLQTHPSEQQASLLESLLDAITRLNRLNKGLILLSKIDNRQFSETEPIDLSAVTQRVVEIYKKPADEKNLSIRVMGDKPTMMMNSALLDILLSNLVSNAVRYATPGSEIVIGVGNNFWSISNNAPALSIPSQKIFERFQKGTSNKDSLGLGLAIAKKISDTNNLALEYAFMNMTHIFTVRFHESKVSPKSLR
jgi:signal transduction histidine kinase